MTVLMVLKEVLIEHFIHENFSNFPKSSFVINQLCLHVSVKDKITI